MKIRLLIWFALSGTVAGWFYACGKSKNDYSTTPFLALQNYTTIKNKANKDSSYIFTLKYKDGDGDIGLSDADTNGVFNYGKSAFYNLYAEYYQLKNGVWLKPVNPLSTADTIHFHERIPVITPTGKQKWIEGQIDLRIPANPYDLNPDTVRLKFRLADRSLKYSEWISSAVIVVNK